MRTGIAALCGWIALWSGPALALDVGSDGSDGSLNLAGTGTTTIDLRLAATRLWDVPSPVEGAGVYDSTQWAVVFKYASVNIGSARIVEFINHPTDAPVVWLVVGDVTIAGTIRLNGEGYTTGGNFAQPGPGGFRGGRGWISAQSLGSAGFGPGGGGYNPNAGGGGGGYGTVGGGTGGGREYGNRRVLPLIGGSGGGGQGNNVYGGGAGGGAILIAANGTITLTSPGGIEAKGGSANGTGIRGGGGSGGGIRLIANRVTGSASGLAATGGLDAYGAVGGAGRIRIEGNTIELTGSSAPNWVPMSPLENDQAVIWPLPASPSVRVTTVAGVPVPLDPKSDFVPPGDLLVVSTESVNVELEARNVPTAESRRWNVKLRVVLRSGDEYESVATYASGDSAQSYWSATLPPLPEADFVAIQARASKPGY